MSFLHQTLFKNLAPLLFFAGLILSAATLDAGGWIGIIEADQLRMRKGPGLRQPVVKILNRGEQVQVLTRGEKWLRVRQDGQIGYIYNDVQFVRLRPAKGEAGKASGRKEKTEQQVNELKEEIAAQSQALEGLGQREQEILNDLDAVQREMAEVKSELARLREEKEAVGRAVAETQKRIEALRSQLDAKREYAERRLVALYKIRRLGELNLLVSAESMQELISRKAFLEKILDYDQSVVSGLLEKQAKLNSMLAALNEHKQREARLERDHQRMLEALDKNRAERERLLAAIRDRKENRMVTLKYLKDQAERLEETLERLEKKTEFQPEKERSFTAYRGLLKMPVDGKIVSRYGKYIEPRSGAPNFRNGIEIGSRPGTPVKAVFDGQAIYADWLKGYGNVVIIAHGEDYHTVYAHAQEVFLHRGESVAEGDVIATVGDSGTLSGAALYFEIRHDGDPINPMEWIDNS